MIRPALFIGLGTTGLNILEHLYDLMLEHYGSKLLSELPIFKFVVFETDAGKKASRVEGIKIEHLTITNTKYINDNINGEKKYLKDWLDINLLDISGGKFDDGASNIRMAGRLCLWENWDKVSRVLSGQGTDKGATTIKQSTSVGKADQLLKEYYTKIGKKYTAGRPVVDVGDDGGSTNPIVYIVGTLNGGTCSGMFTDIAYYAKYVFGLFAHKLKKVNLAPVRSVFTICDSGTLNNANSNQLKRLASNCWAAITEVDFWSHPKSEYKIEYPDGKQLQTNEAPIDQLYLISYSGDEAGNVLVDNHKTLEHKAALFLFTDVVGDTIAEKNAIASNFRGAVDLNQPNKNQCMRIINTFGIAAYWFPKYRISQAAGYTYGSQEICEKWLGIAKEKIHANRRSELKEDAINICRSIVESNKREITTYRGERDLEDMIQKKNIHALTKRGRLDKVLSEETRMNEFYKKVVLSIEKDIKYKINQIQEGKFSLNEILFFLEEVSREVEIIAEKIPSFDLKDFELNPDIWIRLVKKEKDLIKMQFNKAYESFISYKLREPLQKVSEKLGVIRTLPDELRIAGERTILQCLESIKDILEKGQEEFKNNAKEVGGDLKPTDDIEIITNGATLKDDIDSLFAVLKYDPDVTRKMLKDVLKRNDDTFMPLDEFLKYGIKDIKAEDILASLSRSLTKIALDRIKGFDIAGKLLQEYDLTKIRNFAKQSLPHLELTGERTSARLAKVPELLIGKSNNLQQLEGNLNDPHSADSIGFGNIVQTDEIDHMLIFYKEEACLFRDENLAAARTSPSYPLICNEIENAVRKKVVRQDSINNDKILPYTVYSHQKGKDYFDPYIHLRKERAQELIDIAKNILSEFSENGDLISSVIFDSAGKGKLLRHEFRNPVTGRDDAIIDNDKGIEGMAQNPDKYNYFQELIANQLKKIGEKGFLDGIDDKDNPGAMKYGFNNYRKWRRKELEGKDIVQDKIEEILSEESEKYGEIQSYYFPKEG